MRAILCIIMILLMPMNIVLAEEEIKNPPTAIDLSGFDHFAKEWDAGFFSDWMRQLLQDGEFPEMSQITDILRRILLEPIRRLSSVFAGLIFPGLMLAVMGAALPGKYASAGFLCRCMLSLCAADVFALILQAANECIRITASFSDAASPVLIAVLTASGKASSAALISPAVALTGNLIEKIYLRWGLPLCASAGCVALAANLSATTNLNRVFRLIKKLFNWSSGLLLTLFTALILLRGNAAAVSDGLAVRTAKYAVDSVTPVIGSGVSDVWESYLSGLNAARSTVGLSGVLLLLSVCLKPMFTMAAGMIGLSLASSALEITGEKASANCLEQLSGGCQMALTLCGGSMAVWVILMGATLSVGGGIF